MSKPLFSSMEIRLLFFGVLRDIAGKNSEAIQLQESCTLQDLLDHCRSHIPGLKEFLPSIAASVNQEYARGDTKLQDGDEVALLPPVSGGAGESGGLPRRAAIVREKIDSQQVVDEVKSPSNGAIVVFDGVVRNHTRGRRTLYLDYEAYEEMAVKQMEALAQQALSDFKISDARIVHRIGRLNIGETSVLIVVAAEHRGAAFDACRWLIDTLKRTVPIWKKEHFENGVVWTDGEPFPSEIPRAADTH